MGILRMRGRGNSNTTHGVTSGSDLVFGFQVKFGFEQCDGFLVFQEGDAQGDTRKCWVVGAPHFEGCS